MSDSNPEGPTPRTLTKEEDIIQEVKTWDESTNPVDLRAEVKHDSAHLQFSVCIPFDDLLDRSMFVVHPSDEENPCRY